ncbi:hypothetical protein, partial [Alistipes putredinis]|uniref:hypothetical protein n=1 Tax=Alistipes putredinis TaxID=28117 RepID=UPI003AAF18D1
SFNSVGILIDVTAVAMSHLLVVYYRYYYNTSSSPPAIRPLRCSVVTVRIPRPSSPLGFRSTGFGASVIVFPVIALQGRQIAFERLCGHPRTSRRELSGEVFNCHLKPSNRSSDSLNDLLNSSSESIASSSDFIEDSALLKASRAVEPLSEGSDGFQLLNVLLKPSRRLPNRLQSPLLALQVVAHLVAKLDFFADFAVQAVEFGHFFRDSAVDFRSLRPLFIDLGGHGTQFDMALNPKLLETPQPYSFAASLMRCGPSAQAPNEGASPLKLPRST